jgi:uncharacterized OB-fold protein
VAEIAPTTAEQHGFSQEGFLAPAFDADSRPWWDALGDGRLILPRCLRCGRCWFPPAPGCPNCGGERFEWIEASGGGSIYSWVVIARALSPAFEADVPYTILAVDLDEGVRIFGRLAAGAEPAAGARVRAQIYRAGGQALLGFVREDAAGSL